MTREQDLGPWEPIKHYPGVADNYWAVKLYMERLLAGEVEADQFNAYIDADVARSALLDRVFPQLGEQTPLAVLRAFIDNEAREAKVQYAREEGFSLEFD